MDTSYQQLYLAWQRFRKGKKPSLDIDRFAYDLESNLQLLSEQLQNQTYQHGSYRSISVQEKKRRDLAVATVPDRVVHRLLYDYLVKLYDAKFDPDVWSCRKGKGLHKCLNRTQVLLGRYPDAHLWRADIAKFFDHVQHHTLMGCLERKLRDDALARGLCQEIIRSYNYQDRTGQDRTGQDRTGQDRTGQDRTGIPIGNLTSQIFSNMYLHEFDRFVRHILKPKAYIRYGDDFVLFAATRHQAHMFQVRGEDFLRNQLGLTLNPSNNVLISSKSGLKFLGHEITANQAFVDAHTTKRVLDRLSLQNVASYKALYLQSHVKHQFDWLVLEKSQKTIDM